MRGLPAGTLLLKPVFYFVLSGFALLFALNVTAQSLPVGSVAEDLARLRQLAGDGDSLTSFAVRPLLRDTLSGEPLLAGRDLKAAAAGFRVRVLPLSLQTRYLGAEYFALNDGSMFSSRGFQSQLSAGMFFAAGPVALQLAPELVFAENARFDTYISHYGAADLPERFGSKPLSRLLPGQSSLRVSAGPVSVGISTENLWWGPGTRNSLLMSNAAPGFAHLTINTGRPVRTSIGAFEAQVIAGRLEGSGFEDPGTPDDWRYLSGFVFSYSPKWVPGLSLGMIRTFQMYNEDMDGSFGDYFPFFQAFQKVETSEDTKRRDQLASVFGRWLFQKAKAEVYFEYGFNDHAYNTRDLIMNPDHSRAYTLGMKKLMPYKGRSKEFIEFSAEITRMEQSIDRIMRNAGEWYTHHEVLHGYTNRGQVLGAGVGPGGNYQTFGLAWISNLDRLGVQLERFEHNGDLASAAGFLPWTDFSIAVFGSWQHNKSFLFNAKLQGVQSVNYHWRDGSSGRPKVDRLSLNAQLGLMYFF